MLPTRLRTTLRVLWRHRGYTALNVLGLAVGLAACLLIGLYVWHERSYDRFHEEGDRIHRVVRANETSEAFGLAEGRAFEGTARTPPGLAQVLTERFPGVEQATVFGSTSEPLLGRSGERVYADRVLRADTSFFEVFSFSFKRGAPSRALDAPGAIVLTEPLARRLFGSANPMGETVAYENEAEYEVTGVVAAPPSTSSLQFEAVLSMTEGRREARYASTVRWRYFGAQTYLRVRPEADVRALEAGIRDFEQQADKPGSGGAEIRLQPLADVHLHSMGLSGGIGGTGDVRTLYLFGVIGALLLLIACVNYMNLATARAADRAREVGVRKTVGARRRQLAGRFLTEAVLTAALALPLALVGARGALPVVNDIAGTAIGMDGLSASTLAAAVLALVLAVGVGAGAYPALVLSRYRPINVLQLANRPTGGAAWLRRGLVVFQFAASAALILATVVAQQQLGYLQDKQLGFDEERVVALEKDPLHGRFEAFRQAVQSQPSIEAVSAGPAAGVGSKNLTRVVESAATGQEVRVTSMFVGTDYAETLGLEVLDGRPFDAAYEGDVRRSVVLTESAVDVYGLGDDPIGKTIPWGNQTRTVVGVVADFHNESLHEPVQPVVLVLDPEATWTVLARLAPGATREGIDALRSTWQSFLPDRPFSFSFLDREIEAQYRAEQRLATLFGVFAGLAVFVAALGLLGLAAYSVQRRTREIGIRKALGASVADIVGLLSKEYAALVAAALVVGTPLAAFGMHRWLQDFAYRVDVGPAALAWTVGTTVLVAGASVATHAVRAARTDPARAVRQE
jgi:putative ABC transport system permease protein